LQILRGQGQGGGRSFRRRGFGRRWHGSGRRLCQGQVLGPQGFQLLSEPAHLVSAFMGHTLRFVTLLERVQALLLGAGEGGLEGVDLRVPGWVWAGRARGSSVTDQVAISSAVAARLPRSRQPITNARADAIRTSSAMRVLSRRSSGVMAANQQRVRRRTLEGDARGRLANPAEMSGQGPATLQHIWHDLGGEDMGRQKPEAASPVSSSHAARSGRDCQTCPATAMPRRPVVFCAGRSGREVTVCKMVLAACRRCPGGCPP